MCYLSDIDECALDEDDCDVNADCNNTIGSFGCQCHTGFNGTGTTCGICTQITATVEPLIMEPPNSEKPLIMKFFQCTICIHFNTFEPLKSPNNEKNWLSQYFHYSEVPLYTYNFLAF